MVVPRGAWLVLILVTAALGPLGTIGFPKEDLYPFGDGNSRILKTAPDGTLESIEAVLKTPISFYSEIHDRIWVNIHGILSFTTPMPRFTNVPFPLDYPGIAPLYTHVDTRGSGTIYWTETNEPNVVSRATSVIRKSFKNAQDFQPIHVAIATWDNVGYYNAKSDKVNTYQVVISSNGSHSYAEFLYPDQGIQWIQGDSHPDGLPDARAQAGVVTRGGRYYTLKGSGTDQIQNLDKWSNVNNPGQWVFQIGPVPEPENIYLPDNIEDGPANNEIPSCLTGVTTCHSKGECVDYNVGFCCVCKSGFFGNGKSCQHNDLPLRVSGVISGMINGEEIQGRDLQSYVATPDGRTYTAISRAPEFIGASSQFLSNLGGVIGWLFAKPIGETENGYQLTGGTFNHTADITFTTTGDKLKMVTQYLGLDVFGQLKMKTEITGSIPVLPNDARLRDEDYDELYTKPKLGTIISQTSRSFVTIGNPGVEYPFDQHVVISFDECPYDHRNSEPKTVRLKYSRGMTTWEAREGIIRFAVNTKVGPLEEEDPCIEGRSSCGDHSSCLVEGDEYKCVCNPGYQYLYVDDGVARCVDVNECTTGNHVCSPDASCLNNEGSHICQCLAGFTGDGRVCERIPTCEDLFCEEYSECRVIEGEPRCVCSDGYELTDSGCSLVHEDLGNQCDGKICAANAFCAQNADQQIYECICEPGYVGNGETCESDLDVQNATTVLPTESPLPPIPECSIIGCWCPYGWDVSGETCVRSQPTDDYSSISTDDQYKPTTTPDYVNNLDLSPRPLLPACLDKSGQCACPAGYGYDYGKRQCYPLPGYNANAMGQSGGRPSCNVLNKCHPHAQCIFVLDRGSFECQCNPGYEGNGYECNRNELPCLDICDPNASCLQEYSGPKCICNSGYEGDGIICTSIDQCRAHDDCRQNETCQFNSISGRYVCECIKGSNRVDGLCIPAGCANNPSQCHVNAACVETAIGNYVCSCRYGFTGDGVHQCVRDYVGCNIVNDCGPNAFCGFNLSADNYACRCNPGYYGNGYTCLLESSCRRNPDLCSPDAACVPAGGDTFACICNAGFTGNGAECKAIPKHESNILLINRGMATLRMPFVQTPNDPGSLIHIEYTKLAVGIDIDCFGGRVYFSDITRNEISSMTYNGSDVQTFITNVTSSEGLSIDWISRNLFWTDSGVNIIAVANLKTGNRKVLISDGLVNPRGIAVHPYRGKIFWSDWNRAAPRLEWANEDGSERQIFMTNEHVELPNSLAIDWFTDEICWADAGKFTINCANIDSRAIRVVVAELSHPFGLAISQNNYYWTDWHSEKIGIAAKLTGMKTAALDTPPGGNNKLFGIVAVPEYCPPVTNVCEFDFGKCNENQLCLPDGQGGRVCACADNIYEPCSDVSQ